MTNKENRSFVKPFYERRRLAYPIEFSDRREARRRREVKRVFAERRRLAFQLKRSQREPLKIPAFMLIEGEKRPVYTTNISQGGMLIVCDHTLAPGSTLLLEFSFGGEFCHVKVAGQVVYFRQIAAEPFINMIGIKFMDAADYVISFLVKVVNLLRESRYSEEKALLTIVQDVLPEHFS
jgi:hypothetical protein